MSGPRAIETSLIAVEAVVSAGLVIRFLLAGLHRIYPFFFTYLIVSCTQLLGSFFLRRRSNAYGWFFFVTEAVIVCLYALMALELYSLVLRDLAGIASVARRYIRIALALAILASVLLLGLEQIPGSIIARFFSFERPIVSSLAFFVFLITGFLVYYPIPLNRNVINYTIGYAVYFTCKATLLLFSNTGRYWNLGLSDIVLCISASCLIFWLCVLTRDGETNTRVFGPRWSRDEEQRLLGKLEAINASMLRSRRTFPQSRPE